MTIIVYDPLSDKVYADTAWTFNWSGKPRVSYNSKIRTTPVGHKVAVAGRFDEGLLTLIDRAYNERVITGDLARAFEDHDTVLRDAKGQVWLVSFVDGMAVCDNWAIPEPLARGSGADFFYAYYAEHSSVGVALALTLKHAYGCGGEYEVF